MEPEDNCDMAEEALDKWTDLDDDLSSDEDVPVGLSLDGVVKPLQEEGEKRPLGRHQRPKVQLCAPGRSGSWRPEESVGLLTREQEDEILLQFDLDREEEVLPQDWDVEDLVDLEDLEDLSDVEEEEQPQFRPLNGDGGVKKKVLVSGYDWPDWRTTHQANEAVYNYAVFVQLKPDLDLLIETTFTRGRYPKRSRLREQDCGLIPGMLMAIRSMKTREKSEFVLAPEYAYGSVGCPPLIPANATIRLLIELLSIHGNKDTGDMLATPHCLISERFTYQHIRQAAIKEKLEGNAYLESGKVTEAIKCYDLGVKLMTLTVKADSQQQHQQLLEGEGKKVLLQLYLNLGLSYLRLNKYEAVVQPMEAALSLDEDNAKAQFRLAEALFHLARYPEAETYFVKVAKLCPDLVDRIGHYLYKIRLIHSNRMRNEKLCCQKMLQHLHI